VAVSSTLCSKEPQKRYNGSISAGIDSHGAPNALVGLSARQGKINLSLNGMYNGSDGKTVGHTDRYTYLGETTELLQTDLTRNKGHFLFGQIGLDYFVSNKTTISGSYIKVHGLFNPTDNRSAPDRQHRRADKSVTYARELPVQQGIRCQWRPAGYEAPLCEKRRGMTADANYFGVTSNSNAYYYTDYLTGCRLFYRLYLGGTDHRDQHAELLYHPDGLYRPAR